MKLVSSIVHGVARGWVALVVVAAVALGGVAVMRLRTVFGSESIFSETARNAEPLAPFHVKTVIYEIDGPTQTTGSVDYLNERAKPAQAEFARLPWIVTISTTQPVVIANVVAQGDSEHLGCRITVNGEIKDEQSVTGHHAQTSCLVKAA
jgi:hypothetical protein